MRRHAAWFVTLPIVLAGIESAHALANALVGAPNGELFSSAASGSGELPFVAAVLSAVTVAALGARMRGAWWAPRRARLVAVPFALLPPVGFTLLEAGEALSSGRGTAALADRASALGLALQLPVAALGYLLARALLRLSDEVRALVLCLPARRLPVEPPPARIRPHDEPRAGLVLVAAIRGRAPPRTAVLPG